MIFAACLYNSLCVFYHSFLKNFAMQFTSFNQILQKGTGLKVVQFPNIWLNHLSTQRNKSQRSICSARECRAQPLFGLKVATRLIPSCTLAGWLACRHVPDSHSSCCPEDLGALKDSWGGYLYGAMVRSMGDMKGTEGMQQNGMLMKRINGMIWDDSPTGIESMGCRSVISHFQPDRAP